MPTATTCWKLTKSFASSCPTPANAALGKATATGLLLNDDQAPSLSIGSLSQYEGQTGTTAFRLPVSLSVASTQTVTVVYATQNGTATTADNDYQDD